MKLVYNFYIHVEKGKCIVRSHSGTEQDRKRYMYDIHVHVQVGISGGDT